MSKNIARVIVNLSLDKTFDYRIPRDLLGRVHVGSRVDVPFGHSVRMGFVVGLQERSSFGELKEIRQVHGDRPMIPEPLLKLGRWMASYYCCTREQAVQGLLPAVVRGGKMSAKKHKVLRLNPDADLAAAIEDLESRHAARQIEIIKQLELLRAVPLTEMQRFAGPVNALRRAGIVLAEDEAVERDPFADAAILPDAPLALTAEQDAALEQILQSLSRTQRETILLFGVTGSGKTEVYMQAIAACLERDEEAIVLVPEISLTPQTTTRFRARFGDRVSVLHSHLSDGERFDEWTKINEGRVQIVVGARSALFAPFRKLGLIIVDEEHENSYKQDGHAPRYHARDVAVMRGHMENASVVLGTATPSLESYYNAMNGKYRLAELRQRIDARPMPSMELVDMCAEKESAGEAQVLSRRLIDLTRNCLENGEQVIYFLNRRGYATQLRCLSCGFVAGCDDCAVKYTYHRSKELLLCHTCGAVRRAPTVCPECGDEGIRYSGLGTEKIEAIVGGVFPHARVLRMDSDTMTRKDAYRKALTAFRAGAVDILIGTQMIAKGLHFPNVTLVGVIFADLGLYMPDFRAGERTFQLLVQVAGRAGRGEVPGRVVVQTYTPFHPALEAGVQLDFRKFFEEEIEIREQFGYPPATRMMVVRMRGKDEAEVDGAIRRFADGFRPQLPPNVELVDPLPGGIPRMRGEFYFQFLMITRDMPALSRSLKRYVAAFKLPRHVRMMIDVDPMSVI